MNEKSGLADALRDGLLLLASGLGLTLDPPALMGCFLLSTASAVLTRGFSPVLNQRRVYWLSLAAGVLTAVIFLLMDQAFSQRWPNDWPVWAGSLGR